jgi:hypothetical protein
MVEKIKCEHCGAETRRFVSRTVEGRVLNFCCAGCFQVFELLRKEGSSDREKAEKRDDKGKAPGES